MLQNYQNYNYNLQIICCSKKLIHGILFELIPLMRANINQRNVKMLAIKKLTLNCVFIHQLDAKLHDVKNTEHLMQELLG